MCSLWSRRSSASEIVSVSNVAFVNSLISIGWYAAAISRIRRKWGEASGSVVAERNTVFDLGSSSCASRAKDSGPSTTGGR
jgi:hypothetical protein